MPDEFSKENTRLRKKYSFANISESISYASQLKNHCQSTRLQDQQAEKIGIMVTKEHLEARRNKPAL